MEKTIYNVPQDEKYPFDIFNVGDGATHHLFTDAHAGTVIEVSESGKRVVVQRDVALVDPNFKPDIIPGGFAGHCVNQNEQTYTYTKNPGGLTTSYSLRKWRGRYVWALTGGYVDGRNLLSLGRNEYYDFNF